MECMCRNVDEGHSFVRTQIDLSKLDNPILPDFKLTYLISRQLHQQQPRATRLLNQNKRLAWEI